MQSSISNSIPKQIKAQITNELVANYAAISNDYNPIHTSTDAAIQAGFPKKVAHGMLTMAITSRFVSALLGENWMIQSFQTAFLSAIFINDTITISRTINSIDDNKLVIKVSGSNEYNKKVINGKLIVVNREKSSL